MAVVISEIVTEIVVTPRGGTDGGPAGGAGTLSEDAMDAIVRRATERVVELLRREWDC